MAASDLDRMYDAVLAAATGPGGQIVVETGPDGNPRVANFPATLPSFFDTFCALNGAVEALVAGDERFTFAELNARATRLAQALAARGIAKGDRVGIAMKNCASWMLVHMATLKCGAISTLLNGWWQSAELAHALELTAPVLVIADRPRADRIAQCGWTGEVIALDVDAAVDDALAPLGEGSAALPDVSPDDDATILFTSGSTGEAKGAVSTHRAVTTGIYTYSVSLMVLKGVLEARGTPPPNPPRTLVNVPLFHVTGEVPVMLNSFVIGRGMVLMPKWDAGEALRLIEQEKITYFVGVPTMSLELMTHPDHVTRDLSSLTDIAGGGAPRPVSHVERLQEEFPTAQPALGYGLTETNAVGCGNFWSSYAAKPSSTGRAMPFTKVMILGSGDQPLATGEVGEIVIRSAANVRGYWRNEAATAAGFTSDGAFRTGDLGYLDEDGYLFIVDRKKDIIIRGGENISAAEVEAAIYANPEVAEAAVFGVPDDRLGEVPVAILYAQPESDLDEDQLRGFLATRLAAFKVPARFTFSNDPLPRLGTGKIDRVSLKKRVLGG